MHRMNAGDWGLLLTLSVLWGGSFFFVEVALADLPPLTVVLGRVTLAAAALWLWLWASGAPVPRGAGVLGAFAAMGLLNNALPFTLIVWGQTAIPSGLAAILNASTPLFAVVLAHFLTEDERLTPNRLAGVLVGFAGVVVMVGPAALGGIGTATLAQAAVLAAAFCYALGGIYGRRFRRLGVGPLATAAGQVTATALMMLPLVLAVDRPWTLAAPGPGPVAALVGLAVLSTAVAYVLYFRLLARAGSTNLLLVTLLIPVSAILLGALVLGERLEPRHVAGMTLIAAGLACIDGRPLGFARRLRP